MGIIRQLQKRLNNQLANNKEKCFFTIYLVLYSFDYRLTNIRIRETKCKQDWTTVVYAASIPIFTCGTPG